MSDSVITVNGLSKRYRIGSRVEARGMLRESLTNAARGLAGRARRLLGGSIGGGLAGEDFWALKDVSFEVKRGEVVGIIGRNGAGKSTLLKILSRITEPTTGRAVLRGRVGSLLEVGTGFHGELSGRDNIYLSGAILGMKKAEIDRKFDEIVAFSGVEKFLDTPIKHYSSGMNVRLGFAVAAHLDPEILLVDEVLAVGDAEFQKKCLGKMSEVAKGGRTVLFVSHNLPMVERLCGHGLLLDHGLLVAFDPISSVLAHYLKGIVPSAAKPVVLPEQGITISKVTLNSKSGIVEPFSHLIIEVELVAERSSRDMALNLMISHPSHSGFLFFTSTRPHSTFPLEIVPGMNRFFCRIENLAICAGTYTLGLGLTIPGRRAIFLEKDFMSFQVAEAFIPGSESLRADPVYGQVYFKNQWTKA
jgi:lipopolysaccharide transport system ATP-binding protein